MLLRPRISKLVTAVYKVNSRQDKNKTRLRPRQSPATTLSRLEPWVQASQSQAGLALAMWRTTADRSETTTRHGRTANSAGKPVVSTGGKWAPWTSFLI